MTGHQPERTCVGCRRRDRAGNLVRVARNHDGRLVVSRVAPGRGAWLCRDPRTEDPKVSCLEAAVRRNAFSRAYRGEVPPDAQAALIASLLERENMEVRPEVGHHDTTVVESVMQSNESNEKGLTQ